jgi:hypothetical protein
MGAFWQEFGVSPREFLEDLEEWELAVGAWFLNDQAEAERAAADGKPRGETLSLEQAREKGLV